MDIYSSKTTCDATSVEEAPDTSAKLAAVGLHLKGYAQTVERITDQVETFLRRCNGAGPPLPGVDGTGSNAPVSGHFGRIGENSLRLERALKSLDQSVSKLGEIG